MQIRLAAVHLRLSTVLQAASNIKAAVQQELSLTMSFGIATGKLAARLAGPLHKPSGMTVVPPSHAAAFLLGTPVLKIPHLRCVFHLKLVLRGLCKTKFEQPTKDAGLGIRHSRSGSLWGCSCKTPLQFQEQQAKFVTTICRRFPALVGADIRP